METLFRDRPLRTPDYKREAEAFVELSKCLAQDPETILQTLAEIVLSVTAAGSAGISICEHEGSQPVFKWTGLAGKLSSYRKGSIPRALSPCNLVITSGKPELFKHPGERFPYIAELALPVYELLILPFAHENELVGTVWVASHASENKFDLEDLRIVSSLSAFASAAFRTRRALSKEEISTKQLDLERLKLQSIFAQAPTPLVLLEGPDFRFKFANQIYIDFFLQDKQYLGRPVREVLPNAEEQGFIARLEHVYKTGERYSGKEIPFDVLTPGNKTAKYFLNFVYEATRDLDGKIEGIFAVVTDVTEQVLAREAQIAATRELLVEQAKLAVLVAESPSAIGLMRGPDLIFELVNAKWAELVSQRDYIGRGYADVYPELIGTPAHQSHLDIFRTGEPFVASEMKLVVNSPAGRLEEQYFDFANIRILDSLGNPYGVYCNALNVTARVLARTELEQAKVDAEKANDAKSSFLANMSHEIRTPLGAIIGFTDLLRDTSLASDQKNQFLDTISRNGRALTRIIDDILDLAKVESGKLELESVEFSFLELIDDVMDLFREKTRSKSIFLRSHVSDEAPNKILGDPTRLRQILINIVGNAVKFTEVGGVTIRVESPELNGDNVAFRILVVDTGIGLSKDQQQRLFEPFRQADNSTTRKFGGTGLGLALSKRLAVALGGDIRIEAVNNGCTFAISFLAQLPNKMHIQQQPQATKKVAVAPDANLLGIKILLADDSRDNQRLLQIILSKEGAVVETVNNGAEAFRKGISGKYDIVLMDIQMPEMDGYEATRALREAGFKKPIIALTAHAMAEERAMTLAAGCNGHLTKPIDRSDLINIIRSNVQRSGF